MRDMDRQLQDKVGQKMWYSVIWVSLVHLHQQLKTPLLSGKTWWSYSMGHAVRDTKSFCTHCCVPASERFMKYLSGPGGQLTKWPKWTQEKEILEIRPECRVKGQLWHLEGGDGKKENGRQILENPRGVLDSPTMRRHFPKDISGSWCDTMYQPPGTPMSHSLPPIKEEQV